MTRFTEAQKLLLLRKMKERKDDLFGKFTATRTAETMAKAWEDLWQFCRESGFAFATGVRAAPYLRTVVWQNIRRATMVVLIFNVFFNLWCFSIIIFILLICRRKGISCARQAQVLMNTRVWMLSMMPS
jgi:hypothetical protein